MKDSFKKTLTALMRERNMSAAELARRTGLSEAAISGYVNGIKTPRGGVSIKIAEALGVSLDALWQTGFETATDPFERELIKAYRTLDENGKSKLHAYLEDLTRAGHSPELYMAARRGGIEKIDEEKKKDRIRVLNARGKGEDK